MGRVRDLLYVNDTTGTSNSKHYPADRLEFKLNPSSPRVTQSVSAVITRINYVKSLVHSWVSYSRFLWIVFSCGKKVTPVDKMHIPLSYCPLTSVYVEKKYRYPELIPCLGKTYGLCRFSLTYFLCRTIITLNLVWLIFKIPIIVCRDTHIKCPI